MTKFLFPILTALTFTVMFNSNDQTQEKNTLDKNPLLQEWNTPFGVPPFNEIKEEHFEPAFEFAMQEQNENIQAIIDNQEKPNFENTIVALEFSGQTLAKVGGVFYNLLSTNTSNDLQLIAQRIAPIMSQHGDNISMNADLFKRIDAVYVQKDKLGLNKEQMMLLELTYKGFVKGGAKLNEEDKAKLKEINGKLSILSLKFGDNLLAETNNYQLIIDNKKNLAGLPESAIDAAAIAATENGLEGKWLITLHNSSALPFLQYAENRELRKEVQTAYVNRGNNDNKFDNKAIILEMSELRVERAQLLGYKNHASLVLEDNMSQKPENVYNLLNQLWTPALKIANEEAEMYREMM